MTAAAIGGLLLGLTPPGLLLRLAMLGGLAAVGAAFRSLTITVDDEDVRVQFGGGMITRTVPLKSVSSVNVIRTTPIQGFGIHWLGDGWHYNIYGLNAVELRHHDGKRTVVGSDDAENLSQAISSQLERLQMV